MLSNAVLAGGLAATYVALLVLQINPALRLDDATAWPLLAAVVLVYGIHLAVGFYAVIVARQLLSAEGLSPGWVSFRLLAWFFALASTAAAALLWQNLWSFSAALDPQTTSRFFASAVAMTAAAVVAVVLGLFRLASGPPGRLAAWAFAAVALSSVAVPLALRGPGRAGPAYGPAVDAPVSAGGTSGRVILLGLDAASLDVISPAVADGRLPNFARLLDRGASMHLATLRPTQPGPVWAAVATGKLPWRNGARSAATYRAATGSAAIDLLPDFCFAHALVSFGLLSESMQTSAALHAQPLWTLLGRAGISSTVVRWPLTWPAQPLPGSIVSDQYHRVSELAVALEEPGLTYPADLASDLAGVERPPTSADSFTLDPSHPGSSAAPLALDRYYVAIMRQLATDRPARFTALRLQGLDMVGHYFLRFSMPDAFGDVSEDERRLYGRVLDQYYAYVDEELGRLMESLEPEDLLLVVSPFGLEPLSLPKRLLERTLGNPAITGTHERAPDGFMLAYGSTVRPGRYPRGSVVDVTPTLLYYLGLPLGRDMDGFARADIFATSFTGERPIAYVPTYER